MLKRLLGPALLCLSLSLAACQTTSSGGARPHAAPLSPAEFTQAYAEHWRKVKPGTTVRIEGALTVMVENAAGEAQGISLDNAYRAYGETPDRLDEILDHYVDGIASVQDAEAKPLDVSDIIPLVRPRDYIEQIGIAGPGLPAAKCKGPLFDDLIPVLDDRDSLRGIPRRLRL